MKATKVFTRNHAKTAALIAMRLLANACAAVKPLTLVTGQTAEQKIEARVTRVLDGDTTDVDTIAGARAYVIHWFVSRTARHLPSTFSSTTVAPE